MTKFQGNWATWTHEGEFSFLYLNWTLSLRIQAMDCSPTLAKLNKSAKSPSRSKEREFTSEEAFIFFGIVVIVA